MFYVLKPNQLSIHFSQGEILRRDGERLTSVSRPSVSSHYSEETIGQYFEPLSREKLLWLEKTLSEQLRACADALKIQPGDFKPGDFKPGDEIYYNNGQHSASPFTVLAVNPNQVWAYRFAGVLKSEGDNPELIMGQPRTKFIRKD